MPLDTRPAELDATGQPDPWADFRVAQLHDRLRLLRQLCDGHVPVMLNLPDGSALPSALWAVDGSGQRLTFSTDTDRQGLERLVEANEAVAVAYLDHIKLQFDASGLVLVHSGEHSALHCRLPAEIYRFQRRNAYRVRRGASMDAVARLRHPGMPEMQLSLRC
jgi:flagellar brake protein